MKSEGSSNSRQSRWRDMRLIPPMLRTSDAELAAFRVQLRSRFKVPPDTPSDEADLASEELADKIIAYVSSPDPKAPDPPYRVGPSKSCDGDCYATAEPWAALLILIEAKAYHRWFLLHAPHRLGCHRRWLGMIMSDPM